MDKISILFFLLFLNIDIPAQKISDTDLRFFQITKIQEHVTTRWRTGMDFTCSDVTLYYGLDSNNMEEIYLYPGVCGAVQEEKEYEFLHRNPVNGVLYYQLRLGTYGNSEILTLNNPVPPEHAIFPNPVLNTFQIEVKDYTSDFTVQIHNMTGKVVTEFTETKNKDYLSITDLKAGVYFYAILLNNKKALRGKIVKK